jgi:hypothetical protein
LTLPWAKSKGRASEQIQVERRFSAAFSDLLDQSSFSSTEV